MKPFRASLQTKIEQQNFANGEKPEPRTGHAELCVPPRPRRPLEPPDQMQWQGPARRSKLFDVVSYQAASKQMFEGVPGMLLTTQKLHLFCQNARYEQAFEDLQFLIFQDAQVKAERALDKLARLQALLDILSLPGTATMDVKLKMRLFEVMKRLASDSVQESTPALLSASQKRIFDPLHEHQKSLEAKLAAIAVIPVQGESHRYNPEFDVFLIDKTLYNAETAYRLLDSNLRFVKARKEKGEKGQNKDWAELLSKVGGAATCDGECIGWLVGRGIQFALQVASKAPSGSTSAQIVIIERYNDLVLKQPKGKISVEQAKTWVTDIKNILQDKFKDLRPQKDWLISYGCVECLLNIAFRFPEAQQDVLRVLRQPLTFKLRSSINPVKFTRDAFRDTACFQRRIRFKFVEGMAQLALWGQVDVATVAKQALDEVRSDGCSSTKNNGFSNFWRVFFEQNSTAYPEILSAPAAADFFWVETMVSGVENIFAKEPLREANAILRIAQQQFEETRTPDLNGNDIVRFTWEHVPEDVIQKICCSAQNSTKLLEDARKRLFIRILLLAFSCKLTSVRVPDHLGSFASEPDEERKADKHKAQLDNVLVDDIVVDNESVNDSCSSDEEGPKSSTGLRKLSTTSSTEEEPPEVSDEQLVSVYESIDKIGKHIAAGSTLSAQCGRRNVVVIGVTGSGKSTLVNSVAGCTIRPFTQEEADRLFVNRDALTVIPESEGGARDPVTAIGNAFGQSETEVLQAFKIDADQLGRDPFLLWDAPGFSDTNGSEINIANAVNLTKLLQSSQHNGLTCVVVLDAPSLESGRGALLKSTVRILVHLFGHDDALSDNSFLAGTLFCVTKAPDCQRVSLQSLREWIVRSGKTEGLDLDEFREQIIVFDPLGRNTEGCGPEELRKRLVRLRPICDQDKIFETSLTDSDKTLLARIAYVLSCDIRSCLQQCNFENVKTHLRLLNSLAVIHNEAVTHHSKTVLQTIFSTVERWSWFLKDKVNQYTLQDRAEMRLYLKKLKQAQALDEVLPEKFSINVLYTECYETIERSEKQRQKQEANDLETMFMKAKANLRTALHQASRTNPGAFGEFEVSKWDCRDCIREYASIKEVQDLKHVLNQADTYRSGRMPDELYVFGEQGDLGRLIRKYEEQVLLMFQEAQHISKCTLLDRAFDSNLEEMKKLVEDILVRKEWHEIKFFSERALLVTDVVSLMFHGLDPWAGQMHTTLLELHQGHSEVYTRKAAELEDFFQHLHERAIDMKVERAAAQIKQQQDAISKIVQVDMQTWAPKIREGGAEVLRVELRCGDTKYDYLWSEVLEHDSFPLVSKIKRELQTREKKVLDELTLAAESFLDLEQAVKKETEMKIAGRMEQLLNSSFEVVKHEFAPLSTKRITAAKLLCLEEYGFEFDLVDDLEQLLEKMSRIDCSVFHQLREKLDSFLEHLMERAVAESAAVALRSGYSAFENSMRSNLPQQADSIVEGKIDLRCKLEQSVVLYEAFWAKLESRHQLPAVSDTIKGLKRDEVAYLKRMKQEAEQFVRGRACDRKQRDIEYEQCLLQLEKESEKVLRTQHEFLISLHIKADAVSELAQYGFDQARVTNLSSLMAVLKIIDPEVYLCRCKQLEALFTDLRELAMVWGTANTFRVHLAEFGDHIRRAICDKAPTIAAGGRRALEEEFKGHFPDHPKLWKALTAGPHASKPIVSAQLAEIEQEQASLMTQLEREAKDCEKNKITDLKQVHQEFSRYLLQLEEASDIIEENCEGLADCIVVSDTVISLCKHGFDEEMLQDIVRLLNYIYQADNGLHHKCVCKLQDALDMIRLKATDACVEKRSMQVFSVLQLSNQLLIGQIESKAASIVEGSMSLETELITPWIERAMAKIASYSTPKASTVLQIVKDEVQKMVDAAQTLARAHFRMRQREAITSKITGIVTQLSKHQKHDQLELVSALDDLLKADGNSQEYMQIVMVVKRQLDSLQTCAEVERLIGSGDFVGLSARCQMFYLLQTKLEKHRALEVRATLISEAVHAEMNKLLRKVVNELDVVLSSSTYLQFTNLRYFCSVFDSVKATFGNLQSLKNTLSEKAKNSLLGMINGVVDILRQAEHDNKLLTDDDQNSIAKLLIKGYGVSYELEFVEDFKDCVQNQLISRCESIELYHIGSALMQYIIEHHSEEDGVKEMASIIIDAFPAFKRFNIELFNSKANSVSFPFALEQLRCEPQQCNTAGLQTAYDVYFKEYDRLVNMIVQDIGSFPETDVKARIKKVSKNLTKHATTLNKKIPECAEVLGLLCGLWTFLSCEGKSSGLEKKQVMQPHSTQLLGIFRLLGLDQQELTNHLIQINTGEGKSIALGFTAVLLALLGFHVDVVCYSQYLSKRDHKAFDKLFRVLHVSDMISYSDFNQLSNKIMKDGANGFFPDIRAGFMSFLRGEKYNQTKTTKAQSVLLMDEVDVFVSDRFYGQTYNAVLSIIEPEGYQLIKHVWDNRARLTMCDAHVKELLQTNETAALKTKFPGWSDALFEVEIRKLLRASRLFPVSGAPNESRMSPHIIDKKKQRIGYIDRNGIPNFDTRFDSTAFLYLYYVECKQFELSQVQSKICLTPSCGRLLYSKIPESYAFCLGMTGTLDCLSDVQNRLLERFNFRVKTFLPSTFQRQALNANEKAESVETIVEVGSWSEFFERIKQDIEAMLDRGRATLVVFEDQQKLDRFAQEIKLRAPDMKQYKRPKELSDKLSSSDRDHVVIGAIRRYAITLMTRSYGRGTDFVCRDEGLVKNGGVHLIVTFYPQDESENKQINGRTCRQGNPGSSRKILFEQELTHLSVTELEKERTGMEWDEFLAVRRCCLDTERFEKMEEREQTNLQLHLKTIQASEAVARGSWDEATSLFEHLAF